MLATIAKLKLASLSITVPLLITTILATITKKPYLVHVAMVTFLFEGLLGAAILVGYYLYKYLSANPYAIWMFVYALVFYGFYKTDKRT